jgi:hypothetical protein
MKTKYNKKKHLKKNLFKTKKHFKKNSKKNLFKTKKHFKKGGNIIGKGKDGFIIDSLSYDSYNKDNGYLAKIFKQGIYVNKELNNKLKEIDPDGSRFLQYIIPNSNFNKDLLRDNPDIQEYVKQNNFLFDNTNDVVFIKKLNPIDTTKLTKQQYRYLKKSLEILQQNNISHGDLPDNIMLDPETNYPIIIDWENAILNASSKDKETDYITFMGPHFKILK